MCRKDWMIQIQIIGRQAGGIFLKYSFYILGMKRFWTLICSTNMIYKNVNESQLLQKSGMLNKRLKSLKPSTQKCTNSDLPESTKTKIERK